MAEGITRPTYEIFEIILSILVLFLIAGAILFVTNPNFARSYVFEKEISYVSDVTSKNNIVEINLKNTPYSSVEFKTSENKVSIGVNGDQTRLKTMSWGTEYFSQNVKLESSSKMILVVSK